MVIESEGCSVAPVVFSQVLFGGVKIVSVCMGVMCVLMFPHSQLTLVALQA